MAGLEEIREAKELLEAEIVIEEEEERALEEANKKLKNGKRGHDENMDKELQYRALGKFLTGKPLTEEERGSITTSNVNSNSAALLPTEFINIVKTFRNGYKSLKDYCDVIPANSNKGDLPTTDLEGELADLAEDTAMIEGMIDVDPVEYSVKDYGLLKSVANNTLEDTPVDFINGIVAPHFAVAAVNKENKVIMKKVSDNSTAVTLEENEAIESGLARAINEFKPSVRSGLVIATNNAGHNYIDNLKDSTGRRSDDVTYSNETLYFKGKEVIEVDDAYLPALTEKKTKVFYIVNLKTISFFDRKGIEISSSTEAAFVKNKTLIKVIERFDVQNTPNTKLKAKKIEA